MPPGEQPVEVSDFAVERVVSRRCDRHHAVRRAGLADRCGKIANLFIRSDRLAVLHPGIAERAGQGGIHVHACYDKRSKKISLSAFVDPEMRLEKLGRMDFLIPELRFTEHLWLKHECDKLLNAFPLDDSLRPLFINGKIELIFARRKEHVGLRFKLVALILQYLPELPGLGRRERRGVRVQRFGWRHPQFSTHPPSRVEPISPRQSISPRPPLVFS